jgi:hypothetical protein
VNQGPGGSEVQARAQVAIQAHEADRHAERGQRSGAEKQHVARLCQCHDGVQTVVQRGAERDHPDCHDVQQQGERGGQPEHGAQPAAAMLAGLDREQPAVVEHQAQRTGGQRLGQGVVLRGMPVTLGVGRQPARRALRQQRVERGDVPALVDHAMHDVRLNCAGHVQRAAVTEVQRGRQRWHRCQGTGEEEQREAADQRCAEDDGQPPTCPECAAPSLSASAIAHVFVRQRRHVAAVATWPVHRVGGGWQGRHRASTPLRIRRLTPALACWPALRPRRGSRR